MKTYVHTKNNIQVFTAALCITAKNRMSLNMGVDKQTVLYPFTGILLSSKREQTINTWNNMDESQMHYAEWKKPGWKGYILYDFHSGKDKL